MIWLCLLLIPVAFCVALPATWGVIRVSHRLGVLDTAPIDGQTKMARRQVPNTGGVAITLAFCLPLLAGLAAFGFFGDALSEQLAPLDPELTEGLRREIPSALWLLAGVVCIHVLGLLDDRRPMGAPVKLAVILAVSAGVVVLTDTRLLELLDEPAGGTWASIAITILWFGVVTNAMNFMDNMDGVAGGAGAIASGCLLAAMLLTGHWFVAGALALLLGAILGFLVFNLHPARVFMGDGGSLVIGFLLAFLTTRATYYAPDLATHVAGAHAVFVPLLILAVPLYDFTSVTLVRIAQGKSPFKGDLQHFSHRLTRRGLSVRQTAAVIAALTGATGLAGVVLPWLPAWGAILLAIQTVILLLVLALLERASATRLAPTAERADG